MAARKKTAKRKTPAKRKAPAAGELGAPRKPLKPNRRPERRLLGVAPGKKSHNVLSDEAKARQKKRHAEMQKNPPGQKMVEFAAQHREKSQRLKVGVRLLDVCKAIEKLPDGDKRTGGVYSSEIAKLTKIGVALRKTVGGD